MPQTIGARSSTHPAAQTEYECWKTDELIVMDGKLDENAWRRAPVVRFVGIVDESRPPFVTEARMLWDDKYLYAGYYFEEPDIRAYWGMEEVNCAPDLIQAIAQDMRRRLPGDRQPGPWDFTECAVMAVDRFAKLFLDPDGNGANYVEFHCNPLNVVFDAWYKQGFTDGITGNRNRFPSVEWECPGLMSATWIDGSVNAPHDVDRGWSLEMAIPWSSLAPFTQGACPPVPGDLWGAHLGRVFRDRIGSVNEYWVWPFLAVKNCHLPDRYGKLIFRNDLRRFERFFAWGSAAEDEWTIRRALELGVTDLIGGVSSKAAALYAAAGINLYPVVTIGVRGWEKKFPDKPAPVQQMTAEEMEAHALLTGKASPHRSSTRAPGMSVMTDAPPDWNVSDRQRKAIEGMSRSNYKFQSAYQWGDVPEGKHWGGYNTEVLANELLCFNHPEVLELVRDRIVEALAVPGVKGVAFDGIGYQNYRACHCPVCEKLFGEYCEKENKDPTEPASRDAFSLQRLVDFNNTMVEVVKSLKPDAVTVNHIWPAFLPEPLYGNRLKMDFCGQTVAWYMYRDPWRIEKSTRTVVADQAQYWPGATGVPFIGYYDSPSFPVKTPAKVESELRAILRGGSTVLMTCSLNHVLRNEGVYTVFKKFCARQGIPSNRR